MKKSDGKELKAIFKDIEEFFAEHVETPLKKGVREIEELMQKEVDILSVYKELKPKERRARLEALYERKVEAPFKKGLGELEQLLKKEFRLADARKKLLEYDPDSPFSYIAAFLRDGGVASVAPSTRYLVQRVLRAMDVGPSTRLVVEYGPAEGVMTRRILQRLSSSGRLLAVERNPDFVRTVRRRVPDPRLTVVHGDVLQIDAILEREGLRGADVAVSGIPFSFLEPEERHVLLAKTAAALGKDGRFVVYQFTTHLIPLLKRYFRKVKTELEIRNLPPHFVFTAFK